MLPVMIIFSHRKQGCFKYWLLKR